MLRRYVKNGKAAPVDSLAFTHIMPGTGYCKGIRQSATGGVYVQFLRLPLALLLSLILLSLNPHLTLGFRHLQVPI